MSPIWSQVTWFCPKLSASLNSPRNTFDLMVDTLVHIQNLRRARIIHLRKSPQPCGFSWCLGSKTSCDTALIFHGVNSTCIKLGNRPAGRLWEKVNADMVVQKDTVKSMGLIWGRNKICVWFHMYIWWSYMITVYKYRQQKITAILHI